MNRRYFIRNSTIAATFPLFLEALSACNSQVRKKSQNKTLVLIQLIGGNDGLNTLIPLNNYQRIINARPNLFIPENKILPIKGTSFAGLHPSLEGIKDLYDNNMIAFVQGVGFTNPVLSHFRAQDIWLTGSDSKILSTGWMARFLEGRFKNYPQSFPNERNPDPLAIKIGDTGSFLFQGKSIDTSVIINPAIGFQAPELDLFTEDTGSFATIEMKSISEGLLQTQLYARTLTNALNTPLKHSAIYPKEGDNPLADQLKIVAKLINSGLQTSVYLVELKGFDTHQEQADRSDSTKGAHADLLGKLSQAITCFWDDIVHMGSEEDVVGMTFSEFGRRIMSNASNGTDHGLSQPVMFFGSVVNPGIIGVNPVIPEKATVDDNLALQYDYRSIYSSVMKNWLGAETSLITDVLMGDFPEIKIFK